MESRQYRSLRARIEQRLADLLKDPYNAAGAERLRHEFQGLRSMRVDQKVRIIFRVCGECRRLNERGLRPLDCCLDATTPDETVNILCLSVHYAGGVPANFSFDA
jgi:Txe/YoeB family toxin of Txe-Axe toxin-antitoxin module